MQARARDDRLPVRLVRKKRLSFAQWPRLIRSCSLITSFRDGPRFRTRYLNRKTLGFWVRACCARPGRRKEQLMSKSSTTMAKGGLLRNPHPGEILLAEFLKPMGLRQNGVARADHVAARRINEILLGKRDITADTDLRLARYFGLSEGFFLGLQMDYDLMQRRCGIDSDLQAIRPRAA